MTNESLFRAALSRKNRSRPPVWFMRQAGRYHSHYQALRREHSFMDLCKKPEVACEAAMGPIRDFDFDAAILFSDLLFPLETLGMGLRYEPGPKLDWHLSSAADLKKLKPGDSGTLRFQAQAMRLLRDELSPQKGLLGFVGGPLTLFCYAVEGSHRGNLEDSRRGLTDGRYEGFTERLLDLLAENMALQFEAGADTIAVLDTCAGEISPEAFGLVAVPTLRKLIEKFHARCPGAPITYYSKGSGPEHWSRLRGLPIAALGIDWHHHLPTVLRDWSDEFAIQGNIDPEWLFLDPKELESRLRRVFGELLLLDPRSLQGWICGLGHGVLPETPESNVRLFLQLQREIFGGCG